MAPPPAAKPTGDPDRTLNTRSTYSGFKDTGPVAGESKEQKIARLTQLAEAVKRLREEGGAPESAPAATVVDSSPTADAHRPAAEAQAATGAASAAPLSEAAATASPVAGAETPSDLAPDSVAPATQPTSTASHTPTGDPDRSLMTRGSYAGVVDTGPVAGRDSRTEDRTVGGDRGSCEATKRRLVALLHDQSLTRNFPLQNFRAFFRS